MPPDPAALATDAVDVLNDLLGDLVTGTNLFREYNALYKAQKVDLQLMVGVQRMCLGHLALSLSKLSEFWERYHSIVPSGLVDDFKLMNKRIRAKEVQSFRNVVVGHVWDGELGRPLRHSEVTAKLNAIVGDDLGAFLRWLNDPAENGNTYPQTVLSIIEKLRDEIAAKYNVRPTDVVDR